MLQLRFSILSTEDRIILLAKVMDGVPPRLRGKV